MNPIKCTNNIINNLHRALKVILKKLCQNPQICVYTSKFSPVLSGYRQKSKVEKYKSKPKKNHNNLFLRERNNERKNDPIFTHKRTVSKAQLIKAFIIYQSIFQS